MIDLVSSFHLANANLCPPIPPKLSKSIEIQTMSKIPWLVLNISVPFIEMLKEAKNLKKCFVQHRNGGGHSGWRSLCIHGLSSVHTESPETYGLVPDFDWTDIHKFCPTTHNFLKNFGYLNYGRVRFMLLEPGGYVAPHRDNEVDRLGAINIALNQPDNCDFVMEGCGKVPFVDGSAVMLSLSRRHIVWNKSNEDRYHIIVHGARDYSIWDNIIEKSYENMLRNMGLLNSRI